MKSPKFEYIRDQISPVFNETNLCKVWRGIVRKQLRDLEINDLFDYYDFNYHIEERAKEIRSQILDATYKPKPPLFYKIEKKSGICRVITIPQPADAIVLQAIIEHTYDRIIKKQPSKKAYFSRTRHSIKLPHEVKGTGIYDWKELWKAFQKEIYEFKKTFPFIVQTDISNYYDSIGISELKNYLASNFSIEKGLLDIFFEIIKGVSWAPDFAGFSGRGLPVVNIDAVRLVAHSYLFDADLYLKKKTNNNFVRWMDDFTFGAKTIKDAHLYLNDLTDLLKTQSLALNLSKTLIMDSARAEVEFLIDDNLFIDKFDLVPGEPEFSKKESILEARFKNRLKERGQRSWEKIIKRYMTAFTKAKSNKLMHYVNVLFVENPGLRPNILWYLQAMGFSYESYKRIKFIIKYISGYDDITLYFATKLIVSWQVEKGYGTKLLKEFDTYLSEKPFNRFVLYCRILFYSKYAKPSSILKFIKGNEIHWQGDIFLRRQIISLLPRIINKYPNYSRKMIRSQISSGHLEAISISNLILHLWKSQDVSKRIWLYLFSKPKPKIYPAYKFMVLLCVYNNKNIKKEYFRNKIEEYISDRKYLQWLQEIVA